MLYSAVKFLVKCFYKLIFKISVSEIDNIPSDGPCIICMNHISMWDGPLIFAMINRKISFMAKSELFKIPVLAQILKAFGVFPVKRGKADINAIKTSLSILKQGNLFAIFPTGKRQAKGEQVKVKSGVALIALRSGAPVVPIYIDATYKLFSRVKISVGNPIDFSEYKDEKIDASVLDNLSEKIYNGIIQLSEDRKYENITG